MPYIPQERRDWLRPYIVELAKCVDYGDIGSVNYVLCELLRLLLPMKPGYKDYNAAIGVLECAKQEIYRRMVVPYEDEKCRLNGDIF